MLLLGCLISAEFLLRMFSERFLKDLGLKRLATSVNDTRGGGLGQPPRKTVQTIFSEQLRICNL